MDAKEIFTAFVNDLKSSYPMITFSLDVDETAKHLETVYFPLFMKIIQKDETFFQEERILFGTNISPLVNDSTREAIWKHFHLSMIASFLHGDITKKIGTIMNLVKSVWGGKPDDPISQILDDEKSEGRLKEVLDFVMNTRIVKMVIHTVENFSVEDFGLKFDNPQEFIEMIKDPENPAFKKIVNKVKGIFEDKIRRGEISQQIIEQEFEAVKSKVMSIFGNLFNEALGGGQGGAGSGALLSNTPEARRQRMLARLQKKQREKTSR